MDILEAVATIVGIIVGLGTIGTGSVVAYKWFRSRTVIKREELNRLKAIDANHQKCEEKYNKLKASYDSLSETCAPYLELGRKQLVSAFVNRPRQVTVDSGFSHFNPEPVQTVESRPSLIR